LNEQVRHLLCEGLGQGVTAFDAKCFFVPQEDEGYFEMEGCQEVYANMKQDNYQHVRNPSKATLLPVASLGIGGGTTQWTALSDSKQSLPREKYRCVSHDAGMERMMDLVQVWTTIADYYTKNPKRFDAWVKEITTAISNKEVPVIVIKSGASILLTDEEHGPALLAELEKPVPQKSSEDKIRIFVAQNSNPAARTAALISKSLSFPRLCAVAAQLLKTNDDFIRAFHENGSAISETSQISENDLVLFSRGEVFGAPPGFPRVDLCRLHTDSVFPLREIRDKWMLGHDFETNAEGAYAPDPRVAHTTKALLLALRELWYFNDPLWRELREKVHVGLVGKEDMGNLLKLVPPKVKETKFHCRSSVGLSPNLEDLPMLCSEFKEKIKVNDVQRKDAETLSYAFALRAPAKKAGATKGKDKTLDAKEEKASENDERVSCLEPAGVQAVAILHIGKRVSFFITYHPEKHIFCGVTLDCGSKRTTSEICQVIDVHQVITKELLQSKSAVEKKKEEENKEKKARQKAKKKSS